MSIYHLVIKAKDQRADFLKVCKTHQDIQNWIIVLHDHDGEQELHYHIYIEIKHGSSTNIYEIAKRLGLFSPFYKLSLFELRQLRLEYCGKVKSREHKKSIINYIVDNCDNQLIVSNFDYKNCL